MHFKRKKKLSLWEKIKNLFYPKCGIKRTYKYIIKSLFRLKDNAHSIALGSALGIGIALTPFFGLQLILTIIFDIIFHASISASMIFTILGNPITFPFIWTLEYNLGNIFLSQTSIDNSSFITKINTIIHGIKNSNWTIIGDNLFSIFIPMLIGSSILCLAIGLTTYKIVLKKLQKYNTQKHEKTK